MEKTVQGIFKPVTMTRAAFVERWSNHFVQVFTLANTNAEYEELKAMKDRIAELAGAAWDKL